jgi:hypothetical protein
MKRLTDIDVFNISSDSEWSAPPFIQAKKTGDVRILTDFRRLNAQIKRKPFPLPKISVLGVEPGTAKRANPGSWKKISDPQDLMIFNQARKKSSRFLISQEGKLKKHPSFISLLQNNLFRETVFLLLQLDRKQENRDYRMESPFQHYSVEVKEVKVKIERRRANRRIRIDSTQLHR